MQPLQQPMVQCLDLSRPDSISTAGYCADVVTQATRYPQPMLYSPAKGGLVTYKPPGKSGVEELQWLDSMSRPKQVTAKSSKSRPRCSSPQRQQAQLQPCSADQQLQQPQPPPQNQQQQQQQQAQHQQKPQSLVQLAPAPQQQQSHLRGLPPEAAAAVERSTVKAERAAAEAAFTAACQAERQLVSYPQAFSWGGRVKAKHSSLCRMNASGHAVGAGTTQPLCVAQQGDPSTTLTTSTSTHAGCRSSMQASAQTATSAAGTDAAVPPTTSSSNSPKQCCSGGDTNNNSSSKSAQRVRAGKGLIDAEVAASAAQLGANADRLLNLLDRRKQKQQKQQQHLGQGPHQQQRKQGMQRGLQSPVDGGLELHMQDEPICTAGVDYLRL